MRRRPAGMRLARRSRSVASTSSRTPGPYIDMPAHRFPDGQDLAGLELERVVDVDGVLVDCRGATDRAIGPDAFEGVDVRGRAVLVATGWDEHWGTEAYLSDNPFLTGDAAELACRCGRGAGRHRLAQCRLADRSEPAGPHRDPPRRHPARRAPHGPWRHCPSAGWRFFAVPPRIVGMATFPVRAFAIVG